ncbi:CPBP family intramembrane glutamic endopeptidase [Microbacterium sp. NPDC089698]|uniref:CPBP family intramembrane glutamic endopeptidase n=1 Tax=Microbacterium sp. NPDC089698 TaxID=3364200 RepID=UPI0037FF65E4
MTDATPAGNAWKRFWNRGGWWRSLLVVAVYYALYQLVPLAVIGPFVGGIHDPAWNVVVTVGLPIAIGCVILLAFALTLGWIPELFGQQPIRGGWWMWAGIAVVLLFNVLRFATVDYGKAGPGIVVAWLVTGVFVGIAEETLTRGFVVHLLRKAGYREIGVAAISSALFAALHAGNIFGGQAVFTTLIQLVYTFAFGICMYLSLRVTGNLIWPILLHATTDPSIFLQGLYPADGALTRLAAQGNIAVILVGLVLLIFIRGRFARPEAKNGVGDDVTFA